MKKAVCSFLLFAALIALPLNFYAAAQNYTVTIVTYNNSSSGTASASPASAQPGETVYLSAAASPNYTFYYWTVESGDADIYDVYSPNASFTMPSGDVRIRPVFVRTVSDSVATDTATIANKHSAWAEQELKKALLLNLIPDSLKSEQVDYTKPISRVEFAGIIVKTYENLANIELQPGSANPFHDTQDVDASKAHNAGLMVGVSPTEFAPDIFPNREQTATAFTRAFKKFNIPGWSLENDAFFFLEFDYPELYSDDADISDWAWESVYFMTANGIIQGVGNNMFAPRATTTTEAVMGYALTTREEAIVLALRTIEKFR